MKLNVNSSTRQFGLNKRRIRMFLMIPVFAFYSAALKEIIEKIILLSLKTFPTSENVVGYISASISFLISAFLIYFIDEQRFLSEENNRLRKFLNNVKNDFENTIREIAKERTKIKILKNDPSIRKIIKLGQSATRLLKKMLALEVKSQVYKEVVDILEDYLDSLDRREIYPYLDIVLGVGTILGAGAGIFLVINQQIGFTYKAFEIITEILILGSLILPVLLGVAIGVIRFIASQFEEDTCFLLVILVFLLIAAIFVTPGLSKFFWEVINLKP